MIDMMDGESSIQYPIDDQQTSYAVINGVSVLSNTEPTGCPPLHEAIDTDALDRLSADLDEGVIHFDYAGYRIEVKSDDRIAISPD